MSLRTSGPRPRIRNSGRERDHGSVCHQGSANAKPPGARAIPVAVFRAPTQAHQYPQDERPPFRLDGRQKRVLAPIAR